MGGSEAIEVTYSRGRTFQALSSFRFARDSP